MKKMHCSCIGVSLIVKWLTCLNYKSIGLGSNPDLGSQHTAHSAVLFSFGLLEKRVPKIPGEGNFEKHTALCAGIMDSPSPQPQKPP